MAVELYLIRHGLAGEHGSYANDNERPLTEEGRKKTRQVAKRLHDLDLSFDPILTSPLVRARQTAEILVEVGLGQALHEVPYLSPGGDIQDWIADLPNRQSLKNKALALVGHEPDLSTWAEQLLWGESKGCLELKKAGVIGLNLPENSSLLGRSTLFWLVPPRFLL